MSDGIHFALEGTSPGTGIASIKPFSSAEVTADRDGRCLLFGQLRGCHLHLSTWAVNRKEVQLWAQVSGSNQGPDALLRLSYDFYSSVG